MSENKTEKVNRKPFGHVTSFDELTKQMENQVTFMRTRTDPDMGTRAVGEFLKQVRETNGVTLRDAGKLVGMTGQSLSKIEKGEIDVRVTHLYELLKAYNTHLKLQFVV